MMTSTALRTSVFFGLLLLAPLFSVLAQERTQVPNLKLKTIDGGEWSLKANAGSVVVVNFWATWCGPCRAEVPYLVRLLDEFEKKGLRVVGINLDEDTVDAVRKFAVDYKMDYPILIPEPGSPLAKIDNVPTTLLIDARGRLFNRYVGAVPEAVLRRDIEKLIAEIEAETL